ncbi:phenylalanine--tRNA ligase subunit beta [Robiginitomaculum antarcticum]|uniref:phenylalanine--tRNA ligase subunit beta n=1 Tax=Robiginitomaculum antarcticum TaxID=437507 RepID=UPI000373DAB0|nr:phenylalanine--tRNA ligase subunit beta [Robiginitomaculum antarcticum]
MKFTRSWLLEHLETDADIDAIVEAMTLAGLEVESVENPAEKLAPFSIGKVKTAVKHPDADKLKVCTVDTVDGDVQIVCGAPNARAGMTVAYAPMGAYIPGADFSLDKKPRKIRGVESSGMMCSSRELELGDDHDGIMDLDDSLPMGMALADALKLNDPVIDFEVTPNRPDWLGVDNIARDLAATGLGTWKTPAVKEIVGSFPCPISIETTVPDACPVFAGRVVRGVKNGPSPKWLQDRLKAIGLRPISALVDITNFITYDRARPLHFYDVAKLSGDVTVRMGAGETFKALDDKSYTATADDIAICDASGILGLGGIVGGESTGCGLETVDILIESAYFDPLTIRKSAKRLGVNSDAKYRFERGVDTGFVRGGLDMATQMVLDICGGEPSEVVIAGDIPAAPPSVHFDPRRVEALLGFAPTYDEMKTILETLGFGVDASVDVWTIQVPTHRRDVTMQADLVEEIARIAGFDHLPATSLPRLPRSEPLSTPQQTRIRLARRALALRGLNEAVTWSFCARDHARAFGGGETDSIILTNPISADLDVMRPSALIHILQAGQRSFQQGYPGAALFESGGVYHGDGPDGQRAALAGMRRADPARDWTGAPAIDALSAKADALAALAAMGANIDNLKIVQGASDHYHPGRSGRLQMGPKKILAEFGELHPAALAALGVEGRVVGFEVWPDALPLPRKKNAGKAKSALALSEFMPVHRDFAFIVSDDVAAGDILKAAKGADKELISDVSLFDVYRGAGVAEGYKSLAIDVTLSPSGATLTDKEIDAVSDRIIAQVSKAGGELRA